MNRSTTSLSDPHSNMTSSIENNTLSRQKSKQMMEDINRSFNKTTETRIANGHLIFNPSNTVIPFEKTAPLPDFRRQAPLSSTFLPSM
jgi:hypothetical protein